LAAADSHLHLLLWVRGRRTVNRLREALREAPVRVLATAGLIALIWLGLWVLFELVFYQLRRTPLEATVAIPLVFNFFFVAMLVLLTFSNALISYSMLFGSPEAGYLLSLPVRARDVIGLKYLESLLMSSWSLFVLGLPLMLAIARQTDEPAFYPLFVAFFLAFIPIPGALGMLAAWAAARFFPRRVLRWVVGVAAVLLIAGTLTALRMLQPTDAAAETWLRTFFAKMSFVQTALLPNNWVALGIEHAQAGRLALSGCYLGVTVANALFASWVAVLVVSRGYAVAFDRAVSGGGRDYRRGRRALPSAATAASLTSPPARRVASGWSVVGRWLGLGGSSGGGWPVWFFPYLAPQPRLVAAKDLRTFVRDPLQWGQLLILFGLLVLYLTNVPHLRFRSASAGWALLVPFLNLSAISLILATFTCRFVFPLVSLEGQKLWLIGLLPIRRSRILLAKFAFAMTVTLLVALGAMLLSIVKLELAPLWAAIHLVVITVVCFGLCAFAVGLGARLPMFRETNVARIANGFGGTTNLLASVVLVTVVLTGVAVTTWRARYLDERTLPDLYILGPCVLAVLGAVAAGVAALAIGARHFNRVEV